MFENCLRRAHCLIVYQNDVEFIQIQGEIRLNLKQRKNFDNDTGKKHYN